MITKAIIKRLYTTEDNHYIIYIPFLRKANMDEKDATLEATALCISGINNEYKVDDVVYISFEDNKINKPVILGKLFTINENKDEITTTITARTQETLELNKLPVNTIIGETNIKSLKDKIDYILGIKNLDSKDIIYNNSLEELKDLTSVKLAIDYLLEKINALNNK